MGEWLTMETVVRREGGKTPDSRTEILQRKRDPGDRAKQYGALTKLTIQSSGTIKIDRNSG